MTGGVPIAAVTTCAVVAFLQMTMHLSFFVARFIGAFVAVALALSAPTVRADENEQALVSGDTAYLVGRPELVLPGWIGEPYVSWDKSTVVFSHTSPWLYQPFDAILQPTPEKKAPYTTNIIAYSVRRSRPVTLWKAACTEENWVLLDRVYWLAGGEAAIAQISNGSYEDDPFNKGAGGKPEKQLVFTNDLVWLNTTRQTARLFPLNTSSYIGVNSSPTRPEALVSYQQKEKEPRKIGMLSAAGFSPMIENPYGEVAWYSWDADGNEAIGLSGVLDANGERKKEYVTYDRRTRSLREVKDKKEAIRSLATKYPVRNDPALSVVTERTAITVGTTKQYADCVVAQCGATRVIVAVDAKLVAYLSDDKRNRKIVYKNTHGVYAVPIFERPYSGYAKHMREQVERDAMDIYGAMLHWIYENKTDFFPKSADPVKTLVGKDKLKDDLPLRDPLTGALAFENIYSGKPDSAGRYPVFALQTSFGRLTFYNGEPYSAWDTPEPPAKPPGGLK